MKIPSTIICIVVSVLVSASSASAQGPKVKVATATGFQEFPIQTLSPPPSDKAESRTVGVRLSPAAGDKVCEDKIIGEIGGWPETKVEMELSCWDLPFNQRACTNLPRAYSRSCKKQVVAQLCYPSGSAVANAARNCAVAGAAAAVATCIGGGCPAAAPAFAAAAKACVAASAPELAKEVTFGLTDRTDCEGWRP